MELYELHLHFPDIYGSLINIPLELTSTEYYTTDKKAVEWAQAVAEAFVTPRPDYWYIEDGSGLNIWTNSPDDVKRAMHYELMNNKPNINRV